MGLDFTDLSAASAAKDSCSDGQAPSGLDEVLQSLSRPLNHSGTTHVQRLTSHPSESVEQGFGMTDYIVVIRVSSDARQKQATSSCGPVSVRKGEAM